MVIAFGSSHPVVELTSRYECAVVILHSPLMCGLRVAFPDTSKTYCVDAFPNIDKYLKSPLPYLRCTQDEVMAMYLRVLSGAVEPLWVKGTGIMTYSFIYTIPRKTTTVHISRTS